MTLQKEKTTPKEPQQNKAKTHLTESRLRTEHMIQAKNKDGVSAVSDLIPGEALHSLGPGQ